MTSPQPRKYARISAVAALGEDRIIGGPEGNMPWHIPEDSRRFRSMTMGHPVIMGRVTFQEFKSPLPGRLNIVVTRNTTYKAPGAIVVHSLSEGLEYARQHDEQEIFIGGGEAIYREALDLCDRLYLTLIHARFESGGARFPDYSKFRKVIEKSAHDNGTYQYDFVTLEE